jgi:hypothetical protein
MISLIGGCSKTKLKMVEKSSGPQLNSLRDNYNKLVSKKAMVGRSKKVVWESKRRFSNI